MMKMRNLYWLMLVAGLGFGTYVVKYRVQALDEELARTVRQIRSDQDALHVLKAEWSFLNQPAKLDELAQHHLKLAPIATKQLGQIAAIPVRLMPEQGAVVATIAATTRHAQANAASHAVTHTASAGPVSKSQQRAQKTAQKTGQPAEKPAARQTARQSPSKLGGAKLGGGHLKVASAKLRSE